MAQVPLQDALALIDAGRTDEGVQRLREIASSGDPHALFVLGNMTWSGTLVPQDPARGRLLIEYAASLGHGHANLLVTNLLGSGVAGRRDWRLALERLAAEAEKIPARRAAHELVAAMDLDAHGDPRRLPEAALLAEQPNARMFEGLMTAAECAYLIAVAGDLFTPSMVYDSERRLVSDPIRTSDGAAIHWLIEDPAIHALNRRIARASGTLFEDGEPLQVLRYSPGQEYRPHFDFVEGTANRRIWTALMYLNDSYDGGATAFVRTGLEVRGKTGDVLLFRNARSDDSRDPLAEHAGMPVTGGTKYLATRWVREARWVP